MAAVRALGASVRQEGSVVEVEGAQWRSPQAPIDCGNAGTCIRLPMGAAAGYSLAVSDHRIAMAFLVLGLAAQRPVVVERAEMIDTSFPGFTALMRGLGAAIEAA